LGAGAAGLFQVNPTTGLSLFNSLTGTAKGSGLADWLNSFGGGDTNKYTTNENGQVVDSNGDPIIV
jgi:hypothetical protein